MTAILLVTANFMREQRWPVVILMAYALLLAALFAALAERSPGEEVVFYLKQQALYGLALTVLLAATAVNNERKSRRILAVLSKSITRVEYLGGLMLGSVGSFAIYAVAVGAAASLMAMEVAAPVMPVWTALLAVLAASLVAASAALFFSTFMHPMAATIATAAVAAVPTGVAQVTGTEVVEPATRLVQTLADFSLYGPWSLDWWALPLAVVEAAAIWILAGLVFHHRDIAVAVE